MKPRPLAITLTFAASFAVAGAGAGCAKKKAGSTATTSDDNPAVGVVDNASFWVRARTSSDFSPFTKVGDDLTSDNSFSWAADSCELTEADLASGTKDIICYIEAQELDLNFNGLTIQHNIPVGMCNYVTISMPWFYRYPTGYGAANTGYTNHTDTGTFTGVSNYAISGGAPAAKYCPFDYSQFPISGLTGAGAPNCCLGRFSDTIVSDDGAGNVNTTSTSGDWGGTLRGCIAGPALDTHALDPSGVPIPDLYYVNSSGLNGVYTWPSVKAKGFASNLYLANYHSLDAGHDYDNDLTDYPAAMVPSNNVKSVAMLAGNTTWDYGPADGALSLTTVSAEPFAQYICWDRAREARARIRVMVRSWDEDDLIGTATSYNPNAGGSEPAPFPGFPIHDYSVWDTLRGGGSSYLPTFPYAAATSYTRFYDGYPGLNL